MRIIACSAGVLTGLAFAFLALSREEFRKNRGAFWSGAVLFLGLCTLWFLAWMQGGVSSGSLADAAAVAFPLVLGTAAIGMPWGIFFGACLSEKFMAFAYSLVGSGDVPKTYDRAVAHEINARYEDAARAYRRYAEEDPADPSIPERIARCHYHSGDCSQAVRFLQNAMSLLNSKKVRLKTEKKREESARLLYLQKAIREKYGAPRDEVLEEWLRTDFAETRFGKALRIEDPLVQRYLDVWSDCRQGLV